VHISRSSTASEVRAEANRLARSRPVEQQKSNGDESDYRNAAGQLSYIGNFHKGLPHNNLGEVDSAAYRSMTRALNSGSEDVFERITLGVGRRLTNPQAGLSFDLQGPDAHSIALPPAPRLDSAEIAAEMAELYWMAILRDIRFNDYAANADVAAAAASMSPFSDFRGPKIAGAVTPASLFRGFTSGDLVGPYVSQFLLQPFSYGTLNVTQRQRTAAASVDYLINYNEWLAAQKRQ